MKRRSRKTEKRGPGALFESDYSETKNLISPKKWSDALTVYFHKKDQNNNVTKLRQKTKKIVLTTSQKSARTSLDGVSLKTASPSAVDRRAARALVFFLSLAAPLLLAYCRFLISALGRRCCRWRGIPTYFSLDCVTGISLLHSI